MNIEEALKIGRAVPRQYWLDMSPIDQYEEAAKVLAEYIDELKRDKEKSRD